jgi:hypothetical protein
VGPQAPGREHADRGAGQRLRVKDQEQVVLDTVAEYRTAMTGFAPMNNLEVWHAHIDIEATVARLGSQFKTRRVKRTEKALAKARTRESMSAFSKLTREVDGQVRIVADPPLIVPDRRRSRGHRA